MDKIIKKRPGWYISFEPKFYTSAPRKPKKEILTTNLTEIARRDQYSSFKLSEITLPKNVKLEDLTVSFDTEYGYDGDADMVEMILSTSEEKASPNLNYDKELKDYNKRLKEYHKEKAAFKEELAEWKIWCKQEQARQLQTKLKQAEKLLKEHGKLEEKSNV